MSKRFSIVLIAIIFTAILAFIFSEQISHFFQEIWSWDDEQRAKANEWVGILSGALTLVALLVGLVRWILKKDDTKVESTSAVSAPSTKLSNEDLLQGYYQQVHKTYEQIDLALVNAKFTEYTRNPANTITLPAIYQEMDVAPCQSEKEESVESVEKNKLEMRGDKREPLIEASAKDKYRRVVVKGDPGSGKTMFMDNLAWQIAATHLGDADTSLPPAFKNRLPIIRIRLRSAALLYKEEGFGSNFLQNAMQQEITTLMGEESAQDTWKALKNPLLEYGIILLDGLDEVPENDGKRGMRIDMLDAIDELVSQLGDQARLIITSRPYVFEGKHTSWLEAFSCLEIQDMSNIQVDQFITHWYLLLKANRGHSEEEAKSAAHKLYIELENRDYLLEPARLPLILTLLTSLHYARNILPHSRAELYKEAVDLMLERWTQRIHVDSDYPLENFAKKALAETEFTRLSALQKLAFEANKSKTLQIEHGKIKGLFSDFLKDDCNANNLLDFVRYRSGILKPSGDSDFEFYHRTFQTYLAALEVAEMEEWSDKMDALLRKEGFEWWEEVFLVLVSAKVVGTSKSEAVAVLLRYVPEVIDYEHFNDQEWKLLFLAAKATVEQQKPLEGYRQEPYLKLRRFLLSHLQRIVEQEHKLPLPIRAKAGRLLGELGDPRKGVTTDKNTGLPDIAWETIPAGEFKMGTEGEEGYDDEKPAHLVEILNDFQISRYPITNAQFACFVEAGGYEDEKYWQDSQYALDWLRGKKADLSLLLNDDPDLKKRYQDWLADDVVRSQPSFWEQGKWNNPNHPVVGVSWYEALAFCNWLNSLQAFKDQQVGLPTEAEWEYAARGNQGLRYAWGKEADSTLGNYQDSGLGQTSSVGLFAEGKAFPDSDTMLYDMSGNVWEWTSSQWGTNSEKPDFIYENWKDDDNKRDDLEADALRITRGGSWYDAADLVRCAIRSWYHPDDRGSNSGFRVVSR